MERLILVAAPEQLEHLQGDGGLPPFDPEDVARHSPDAHWVLVRDSAIVGRCSLWWKNVPSYPVHRVGMIGHYAVTSAAAAHRLLRHACEQLKQQGCTLAVGPLDGNTWRRYRLLTERGSEPAFFMEPDNPDEWPQHFRACGFSPLAHYSSAINSDLNREDTRVEQVAQRMDLTGVSIRSFDPHQLEDELRRIYAVSQISFRDNFLYTPLDETEFVEQYRPFLPYVRPELVLIAERGGHTVGFSFTLPDLLQAKRGQPIDTIIIKTVAVLPGRIYAGLGSLLVARSHRVARELGYRRAIHALMHDANNSRNLSRRSARTMRGYTLFARPLA